MTTWILLRGLARESAHWGGFLEQFADAMETGDRMVALDLPGNGSLHEMTSPASVPALALACRNALAGRACEGSLVLVAMSLGAMVALQWSREFPEEIAGCVLINTSLGGRCPFWERLRPQNYASVCRLLLPGLTAVERERRVLAITSARPQRHAHLPQEWATAALARPVRARNVVRQLLAAACYRAPEAPPQVPMLVLVSAADRLVSPRCSIRLAAAWNLPLRLHPCAGHDLPLDDPHWLIDQIRRWWRSR